MTDPEGVRPADSPSTLLNQFLELNPDTRRTGPATAARPCRCGGEVQFTDHGDRVAWKCVEGTCGKSGAFTAADLAARSKRQAPPAPGFILGDEDTPAPSGSRPALPVELDPGPLMLALLELAGDGSHDEPMDPGEADARMLRRAAPRMGCAPRSRQGPVQDVHRRPRRPGPLPDRPGRCRLQDEGMEAPGGRRSTSRRPTRRRGSRCRPRPTSRSGPSSGTGAAVSSGAR